jgi:hypothetical protein
VGVVIWRYLKHRANIDTENKAGHLSRDIASRLETARDSTMTVKAEARGYPADMPLPYGSDAQALHVEIDLLDKACEEQAQQLEALQAERLEPPDGIWESFWFPIGREQTYWQQRLAELDKLDHHVRGQVEDRLATAEKLLKRLRGICLHVAQEAQELRQALDKSAQIAAQLYARNCHGETLDRTARLVGDLQQQLETLPECLFSGSPGRIQRTENEIEISRTWLALQETQKPADVHLQNLSHWLTLHGEFGRNLEEMHAAIQQVTACISKLDPSIDVGELSTAWALVCRERHSLEDLYAALTVEDLSQARRVRQITLAGQGLVRQIEQTKEHHKLLGATLTKNASWLADAKISIITSTLIPTYPLAWGAYGTELADLEERGTHIEPISVPRTPGQIARDLKAAQELNTKARTLRDSVSQACQHRQTLVALLGRPELHPESPLLERASDLYDQMEPYARRNWSRKLSVPSLPQEIAHRTQRWQRWVPANEKTRIPVDDLAKRIAGLELLSGDMRSFQERIEGLDAAWSELQEREFDAYERLAEMGQALERCAALLASAAYSFDDTPDSRPSAILKHRKTCSTHFDKLDQKGTGTVSAKSAQAAQWARRCQQDWEAWLASLESAMDDKTSELRQELERLNKIASFDQEPAMRGAQALVALRSSNRTHTRGRSPEPKTKIVPRLIERTDKLLEDRAQLYQKSDALRARVSAPIAGIALSWAESSRQAAYKLGELAELDDTCKQARVPFSCGCEAIARRLNDIARDENRLAKDGHTVQRTHQILVEMHDRYAGILAAIEGDLSRYQEGLERLVEILSDIDQLRDYLDNRRSSYAHDEQLASALRARIDLIDNDLRAANSRRRRRSASYDEALDRVERIRERAHAPLPLGPGRQTLSIDEI